MVSSARGAFLEGWLLVFPERHVTSLRHLSSTELRELDLIIECLRVVFLKEYGVPLFAFEHGSPTDRTRHTGRCVDHAHLHCMPHPSFKLSDLEQFTRTLVSCFSDLLTLERPEEPYVLVIDGSEAMMLYETGVIPSQWMRRIMAKAMGVPELWDWRLHPQSRVVEATNQRMAVLVEGMKA